MEPKFTRLFLKSIILLAVLFLIIQITGITRKKYISNSAICPDFGNLSQFRVPKSSVDVSSENPEVAVINKNGERRKIPISYLDGALFIKSKNEFEQFINTYEDICGGKPHFYASIDYIKIQSIRQKEEFKKSILDSDKKISFHQNYLSLQAKWKKLNSDKMFLENKISFEQKSLEKLTPIQYKIIGKVAEEGDKSIIIFGSALPDVSGKVKANGYINNGVIILKNPSKKDIVSPKNSEFKHVMANDYQFVRRIDGRDSFGHYMPVHIFQRKPAKIDKSKIFAIQSRISRNQKQLNEVEKELQNIQLIEEKFIASSF